MKGVFKFTKFKLIAGHAILLVAIVATICFVQQQVRRLPAEDPAGSISQQKLFLVSRALARLNEAEALALAIPGDTTQEYLSTYVRVIREVKRQMDTLRLQAVSLRQKQQVDAVKALLDRKIENMEALAGLFALAPADFYDRSLHALVRLRDSSRTRPGIQVRRETSVDSVYIQPRREGFWSFLKRRPSPVLRVNTSERIMIDTLPAGEGEAPLQDADTVLRAIRSAWDDYQQQSLLRERELHRQEILMSRNGQRLSNRVEQVLALLEEEEIENALSRADERERITRELSRTIATVATVACLFLIVLVTLVFNDISRSQRYRKALEESNRYTRKLLAGREKMMLAVTHDIKSPLNSITGYVELLDNTPLGERQHYFLRNVKRSAGHILQLVNALLDFSRLESGKMEVDRVRYNPARLVREVVESFFPRAAGKGLELAYSVDASLEHDRMGDPLKIRQVIINLLSNAIKYTRKGSVRVTAACPGMLDIVVSDTGAGMTAGEQQLVFEEFMRLDAQHNDDAEGTGLGLTITRKLVELLGGTLLLTSVKGEGSTFTVRLPAGEALPGSLPPVDTVAVVAAPRVLVIDDDPVLLEMIAEFLRQRGIACETLDRSDRALARLEESSFDLLVTDIQMPGSDGFQLLEQVRGSTRREIRELPVIAQSATSDMTGEDYVRVGFSAYLNKPYTPQDLLECIARLTGGNVLSFPAEETREHDLSTVRLFAGGDEGKTREIVEVFVRDCCVHFRSLEEFIEQEDYSGVRRLAHKMLPMFKQFAIAPVIPSLAYLEQADPLDPEKAREAVRRVIDRGKRIIALLLDGGTA